MDSKPLLKSKTLWVNAIVAIAAFFPSISASVSPDVLLQVFAGINIVLRLVSKDKVVIFE